VVKAIMRGLCQELRQRHENLPDAEFNIEKWITVGLLHGADYKQVEQEPARHTLITEEN
jgi:predicted hydrolase (HD superfamily)